MDEIVLSVSSSDISIEETSDIKDYSNYLNRCTKSLSDIEKRFLDLVGAGSEEELRNLLQKKYEFNVDCCDYRGEKALEIAVRNNDSGFVEFLLGEIKFDYIHYYCGILRAVLEDNLRILIILLGRCDSDEKIHSALYDLIGGGDLCLQYLHEVVASHLTPLMAAVIRGNVDIARVLLQRGYQIAKPHRPKCKCAELCMGSMMKGETLLKSLHRMNTYRAISSSTYILLTSDDPVLTAFELSLELKFLSKELPENGEEYRDMADQCASFATDLLDQCRTTEEVKIILQQKKGFPDLGQHRFRRLKLAIREGQKKFVAHSSCQQVLRSLLMGPQWNSFSTTTKLKYIITHSLMTLPVCSAYIFLSNASLTSSLKIPFNRFIYYTTSYVVFLIFLLITLFSERFSKDAKGFTTTAMLTETAVTLWVIGFALDLFFQYRCMTTTKDPLSWFRKNIFDISMVVLFFVSQTITMLRILRAVEVPQSAISGVWTWPITIGYALYATSTVLAFNRMLQWCYISADIGPLIVSLKYMMGDILRFFVIFSTVIFSFAIGLNSIYKDFRENNIEFVTLQKTIHNLFWAIFGKGESSYTTIQPDSGKNSTTNAMLFSEMTGYSLWGVYHWITALVLLNMLIGMMAESYQRVLKNADVEWKFGCTTFWYRFIDCSSLVPPPFNLVPSMTCGSYYYKFLRKKLDGTLEGQTADFFGAFLNGNFYGISENDEKYSEEDYKKLLVVLICRYLHSKDNSSTT